MDVKELTSLAKQIQLAYTQVSWEGQVFHSPNFCKQYSLEEILPLFFFFWVGGFVFGKSVEKSMNSN